MKIGIIGAMEEEVRLLKESLTNLQQWQKAGAIFYQGEIGDHQVVVVQSGIGKVLASLTTTLLISHYQVELIINTGSAGALNSALKIGDVVISEKVAYHDVDLTGFNYEYGQMAGMPLYYPAATNLIQAAKSAALSRGLTPYEGVIVTGDLFVNSQKELARIQKHFPQALASEMEGAAIAQTAFQFGLPFVVVRAISDGADDAATLSFDEFIVVAGKKSAEMTLALIKEL